VEIILNTSNKRSSNIAPFDKISKSGDGGGIFPILISRHVFIVAGKNKSVLVRNLSQAA
jgi:hypothetical protein